MSKLFKFITIISLVLIIISSCSYVFSASSVDMNLGSSSSSDTSTVVSQAGSYNDVSDFTLRTTNILCIVLIVVGAVLILLGFAIIVRLKSST